LNHTIEIFTDGSCHTQQKIGAWAALLLISNEKIILNGTCTDTTHNRMELLAVINAIDFIDMKQFQYPVTIYTDSQYVSLIPERKDKLKLKKLATNKGTPVQNADLIKRLIDQIESHDIHFVKVKAHQKGDTRIISFNTEVDKLARQLVRENIRLNT
jgi:ribonuclease HI